MELRDWTETQMDDIARVYKGVAHKARIAILVAISSDLSMTEVAAFFDMERPSLQDHINRLIDAELIYRPEEEGKTYDLTPIGEYIVDRIRIDHDNVVQAISEVKGSEQELREDIESERAQIEGTRLPIDEKELERQIHTEKWEMNWEDVKEILSEEVEN